MDYGTEHEVHAASTVVERFLPAFMPSMSFYEEGSHVIFHQDVPLILVSPDGSIRPSSTNTATNLPEPVMAVEIKCPFPNKHSKPVHYELPKRYITQILAEMACLKVKQLLYVSWSEESTTLMVVKFDEVLWNLILEEAYQIYGHGQIPTLTKQTPGAKAIKAELASFQQRNVKLLLETSSATSVPTENTCVSMEFLPFMITNFFCDDLGLASVTMLPCIKNTLKHSFELTRKKATEVLVWLVSDVDRAWRPETPHSVPVAYGLKSYSLTSAVMRNMTDEILAACHEKGVHVACTCFDGQWLTLATRSKDNQPLTLLQLQQAIWEKVKSQTKEDVVHIIANAQNMSDVLHWFYHFFCGTKKVCSDVEVTHQEVDDGYLPVDAIETLVSHAANADTLDIPTESSSLVSQTDSAKRQFELHELSELKSIISKKRLGEKALLRWSNYSLQTLQGLLKSAKGMLEFTVAELNEIIDFGKTCFGAANVDISKSWVKGDKINGLALLFGLRNLLPDKEKMVKGPPLSLKQLASSVLHKHRSGGVLVRKLPKRCILNIVAAKVIYPVEKKLFEQSSPFPSDMKISGMDSPKFWFSYPETNAERNQLEPKCVDSHHLFVNLRTKVCRDGLSGFGISKEAWSSVAKFHGDILSPALVNDLIDKQSNGFARATFSEQVQEKMEGLGFEKEAKFCEYVRNWYEADDSKGIPAEGRIERRLRLRSFLLDPVDFSLFPPYGQFVMGMSKQMYEGFLQNIDTKNLLYLLTKQNTYNVRAVGSLQNETFFGQMSDMEPTKLGCPKAIAVPRLMSTITELMHFRHNPDLR